MTGITEVFAGEPLPDQINGRRNNGTIFLGGPLPRSNKPNQELAEWREITARPYLAEHFDGIVITPERREGATTSYEDQAEWEQNAQNAADVDFYWLTRTEYVQALSTLVETGQRYHFGPRRVVIGIPEDATEALKTEFSRVIAARHGIEPIFGLEAALDHAISLIGEGAERYGGECQVPLYVWKTASFQAWNNALKAAGNRLDSFNLVETLCPVPAFVLYWIAKASIWVESEQRHKSNEWVISRPDISHIVLVYRDGIKTHVVGVSEFRSTVRNPAGRVFESAGGSSTKPGIDPIDMGVEEVFEETGLTINRDQLTFVAQRQLAATTTAHHAYVMVGELTREQFEWADANRGRYAGNSAETERCALTVMDLKQLFTGEELDWSNLGMTTAALLTLDADRKENYTIATYAQEQYALVVLDAFTGSSLDTILGIMAAGTTVVYAGKHRASRGYEKRVDIATTLRLHAVKMQSQGIDAKFIHLSAKEPEQLRSFLNVHAGAVMAIGFAGDHGLSEDVSWQLDQARAHNAPVAGIWSGSTPQPELVIVNDSLAAPDDGYLPFVRQWAEPKKEMQICRESDYAVVSIGRLTPAAYYRLASLMIAGTHIVYGGAPVAQDAPAGRIHITRTLQLMQGKLGVAGIPAQFTSFSETDVEARRLQLLALAQKHSAPVLAFVDDQGIAPGVAQECTWAHASGLAVTGMWVGSMGGFEFQVQGDALDVDASSLRALAQMRLPGLVLA